MYVSVSRCVAAFVARGGRFLGRVFVGWRRSGDIDDTTRRGLSLLYAHSHNGVGPSTVASKIKPRQSYFDSII